MDFNMAYWTKTDEDKQLVYAKFVKPVFPKRRRVPEGHNVRKKTTYQYYMPDPIDNLKMTRVCRTFFINTLHISERRIRYFFTSCESDLQQPQHPHGKHIKKVLPHNDVIEAKQHIMSFKIHDSHYCRPSTSRFFMERGLSRAKAYELYVEQHGPKLKSSKYHELLRQLNVSFSDPKKDQCEICFAKTSEDEHDVSLNRMEHRRLIEATRIMKKQDVAAINNQRVLLSFDLQQVLGLPQSNVSIAFYKSKLNCYNLTVKCANDGVTYCSMWHEALAGRAGDEISSALIAVLKRVLDKFPEATEFVFYSDNAGSQNKNSHLSTALLIFMKEHTNIATITHKYGVPGHSPVTDVDSSHSVLERIIRNKEIYTPGRLIELYNTTKLPKFQIEVLELARRDFREFKAVALNIKQFKDIPYQQVHCLQYNNNKNSFSIEYKIAIDSEQIGTVYFQRAQFQPSLPKAPVGPISECKISGIKAMFKFMSEDDIQFFRNLPGFDSGDAEKQPGGQRKRSKQQNEVLHDVDQNVTSGKPPKMKKKRPKLGENANLEANRNQHKKKAKNSSTAGGPTPAKLPRIDGKK